MLNGGGENTQDSVVPATEISIFRLRTGVQKACRGGLLKVHFTWKF